MTREEFFDEFAEEFQYLERNEAYAPMCALTCCLEQMKPEQIERAYKELRNLLPGSDLVRTVTTQVESALKEAWEDLTGNQQFKPELSFCANELDELDVVELMVYMEETLGHDIEDPHPFGDLTTMTVAEFIKQVVQQRLSYIRSEQEGILARQRLKLQRLLSSPKKG